MVKQIAKACMYIIAIATVSCEAKKKQQYKFLV